MILKVHSIVPVSISIFIAIIYVFSSFIVTNSSFAQSDNYNNTQTKQRKIRVNHQIKQMKMFNKVPIKQGKATQGNASDCGSNISEGANNLGKNITEVAIKLDEAISKKLRDLAN